MKPRDWYIESGKFIILNCHLPKWYDNVRDYKYANYVWTRNGKWKQSRPGIKIFTLIDRILVRQMKKFKMT